MNWLYHLLFPRSGRTIRISPDHLPGLKPPQAPPRVHRHPEKEGKPEQTSVEAAYAKYLAKGGSTQKKRPKNTKGVKFE